MRHDSLPERYDSVASVLCSWLMGHDIGIAKHYLADNIKQEYEQFELVVRFAK